jgi:hypothetical protein
MHVLLVVSADVPGVQSDEERVAAQWENPPLFDENFECQPFDLGTALN